MCELIVDCPHFTPEWTEEGFVVVRNQNIRDGKLDLSQPSFTHQKDFERRIKRAKPKAGDIIFTREAPMGEVCLIPEGLECCLGQRQVLLRPKSNVDNRYLFFSLRSAYVRHQILWNEGTGSTVSNVRIPVLEALKIPRLGKAEKNIGEILGALDDKIDLNRRMNETLEQTARALFKDWFVDFGPTQAKMAGQAAYLEGDLWNLFPARLGEAGVPEGWCFTTLSEVALLNPESWTARSAPEQVEYVDLANTKWGTIETTSSYFWDDAPSRARRVLKLGDTIVGTVRPGNGSYAYVGREGLTASTGFAVLRPKQPFFQELSYCAATSKENIERLAHLADGGAYPAVRPDEVLNTDVHLGSEDLTRVFSAACCPLLERVLANEHESYTLAQTRDLLLPKLMSGELRVRDAEALVAEQV